MCEKAWRFVAWSWLCALAGASCVDGLAPPVEDASETVEIGPERELELIGISGRTLTDGESYRVPLDSERIVAWDTTAREAMVLVNRGRHDVLIESFTIGCDTGEWRLVAPTRARELPLAVEGVLLHPEGRIDLDVAFSPRDGGVREAWLELTTRDGVGAETRRVRLWAKVASPPGATGPGPPR